MPATAPNPEIPDKFVGRRWLFEKVDQWLSDGEERIFLLTGAPGSGKSALATRLALISQGQAEPFSTSLMPNFLTYSHFCHGDTDIQTLLPHRFVESLSAAIVNRHDGLQKIVGQITGGQKNIVFESKLSVGSVEAGATVKNVEVHIHAGNTPPDVAFDQLVRQPLEKLYAASPQPQTVILVDALDEALDRGLDVDLLDLLRQIPALPPPARWIITCRPDERILSALRGVTVEISGEDNEKDLYEFARERLDSLEETKRESLAVAIKSKGNFLYAQALLSDAKLIRELAGRNLEEFPLPGDLQELYRQSLRKHGITPDRNAWEWYQPILGALAASFGTGLTAAQLAAVTRLARSKVDRALLVLAQFCSGPRPDGPLQIYHPSFRAFLRSDRIYRVYPEESNQAIWRYFLEEFGKRWPDCDDRYALRYTPSHLAESIQTSAGQRERTEASSLLWRTLTDFRYLESTIKLGNVDQVISDLRSAAKVPGASLETLLAMGEMVTVIDKERAALRAWPAALNGDRPTANLARFAQQVRNRAAEIGYATTLETAAGRLTELRLPYFLQEWSAGHRQKRVFWWDLLGRGEVSALAMSPDEQSVAVGQHGGGITIQLPGNPDALCKPGLPSCTSPVLAVGFGTDGAVFAIAANAWATHWNLRTGDVSGGYLPAGSRLRAAAIAESGLLLTASVDGVLAVWNIRDRTLVRVLVTRANFVAGVLRPGKSRAQRSVAIARGGGWAASIGHDGMTTVWNLADGSSNLLPEPEFPPSGNIFDKILGRIASEVSFSTDDRYVIAVRNSRLNGGIKQYDLETRQVVAAFSGGRMMSSARYLRDGRFACVHGFNDLVAREMGTGQLIGGVAADAWISCIETLPGGDRILAGARDGGITCYRLMIPTSQ